MTAPALNGAPLQHPPPLLPAPALLCLLEQFCRLNLAPEAFPETMRPLWSISPSYFHYKGCTCMGGYTPSYVTK